MESAVPNRMVPLRRGRILFIDAYDSFSNNIIALLSTLLEVDVFVLTIDSLKWDNDFGHFLFYEELAKYDAVVCGPGPGNPQKPSDVGIMQNMWRMTEEYALPVLGICLGFQALVHEWHGGIRELRQGLHGMVRQITPRDAQRRADGDIFRGVQPFDATLYHSLGVDIGQDDIPQDEWAEVKWQPTSKCPDLVPLAWVEEKTEGSTDRILMAVKHKTRPLWGLQYHPESICTDQKHGNLVLSLWWKEVQGWNTKHKRKVNLREPLAKKPCRASLLSTLDSLHQQKGEDRKESSARQLGLDSQLETRLISIPRGVSVSAPEIVELLQVVDDEHIILDSASAIGADLDNQPAVKGRFSIIALEVRECLRVEYHAGSREVNLRQPTNNNNCLKTQEPLIPSRIRLQPEQTVWHFLADFLNRRRVEESPEHGRDVPFIGGFMGYITYEQGLVDIGIIPARRHSRPDICFAWVTKSIVIDHVKGLLHVQHLRSSGAASEAMSAKSRGPSEGWLGRISSKLLNSASWKQLTMIEDAADADRPLSDKATQVATSLSKNHVESTTEILGPNREAYETQVQACHKYITEGQSYELCLTAQTFVAQPRGENYCQPSHQRTEPGTTDSSLSSWKLYKELRTRQPAPFGSYIRLGDATIVSSSPERFLTYSSDGLCSMRPMKGTVRKSDEVNTVEKARTLLHVPKEKAENLMIVDLVRHDLHGVCGAGNVWVKELFKVEEYRSVYQMVTVVEGQLPAPKSVSASGNGSRRAPRYSGLDVLAASLPPGSMTGAPKKRSCELLQTLEEGRERSLYSGVVGYMCATGRGDWSVTIRSMFRWDDETTQPADSEDVPLDVWHIGAGGAVTALSTPEGEASEMFTKRDGPLFVLIGR